LKYATDAGYLPAIARTLGNFYLQSGLTYTKEHDHEQALIDLIDLKKCAAGDDPEGLFVYGKVLKILRKDVEGDESIIKAAELGWVAAQMELCHNSIRWSGKTIVGGRYQSGCLLSEIERLGHLLWKFKQIDDETLQGAYAIGKALFWDAWGAYSFEDEKDYATRFLIHYCSVVDVTQRAIHLISCICRLEYKLPREITRAICLPIWEDRATSLFLLPN
jgi:hypothetical protein